MIKPTQVMEKKREQPDGQKFHAAWCLQEDKGGAESFKPPRIMQANDVWRYIGVAGVPKISPRFP